MDTFECHAINNKNKISYLFNNNKYTINYSNKNNIIFKRETKEFINIMTFSLNKKTFIDYSIKEEQLHVEIEMLTKKITIKDNFIKINYQIIDSGNEYEYYLEMSD